MRMKDPLLSLPGYLLRRASAASLAELNGRLAGLQLRHTDVSLLLLIAANPGITQSDAGRILDVQRANMVPFIARLEAQNLISRRQVDGRSQGLSLTSDGEELTNKARVVIEAYEAELLGRVPAELREHLVPILLALWQRG
jgi:DNA-binding MarR family transcriptional regulator